MFILQLLCKEGLFDWYSLPLMAPNNNNNKHPDCIRKTFKAHLYKHLTSEATGNRLLNNFQQLENESIADLHIRLTELLEKCDYNQCHMNTHKADLFISAVEIFCHSFMGKGTANRFGI